MVTHKKARINSGMIVQQKDIFSMYNISEVLGKSLAWWQQDTEEHWNEWKDKDPLLARFKEKPIEYKFNSLGFRTPEIDTFQDGTFFLALGCSYTAGVGLYQEDLWCEKLAEKIGMPCMNLGIAGGGNDIFMFLTEQYQSLKFPKPKFVVCMVTEFERRTEVGAVIDHDGENAFLMHPRERDYAQIEQDVNNFDLTSPYKSAKYIDCMIRMWENLKVPVLLATFEHRNFAGFSKYNMIQLPPSEKTTSIGRDRAHNGHLDHEVISDLLVFPATKAKFNEPFDRGFNDETYLSKLTIPTDIVETQLTPEEIKRNKIMEQRNRDPFIYR